MPPVIGGDIWQFMLLLEAVDHSQRAHHPGLSEGVEEQSRRRFDARNLRYFSARVSRLADHKPPSLRAISITAPAYKAENLTRNEADKFTARRKREPFYWHAKHQPVTRLELCFSQANARQRARRNRAGFHVGRCASLEPLHEQFRPLKVRQLEAPPFFAARLPGRWGKAAIREWPVN